VRVLYVNHTAQVSGGERSLLTLLGGLPEHIEAHIACPPGPLADLVRAQGLEPVSLPGIDGSLKLHPMRTAGAIAQISRAALAVRRAAAERDVDLIHANSIRAGIVSVLTTWPGGPAVVTHVRDCLPHGPVSTLTRRVVCGGSAVVLANSRYTADRFVIDGTRAAVEVAHSPVDLARFDPQAVDRPSSRERLGLDRGTLALGVVAQITPWKGQVDAIRILAALKRMAFPVRLLLVGSAKFVSSATRYDNVAYTHELRDVVDELGVHDEVQFLGERDDVPDVLAALDILLAPSWEEPLGRAVAEGMTMGVPVVATNVGGPAEIVRHAEDGWLLPPRQPELWAREIGALLESPARRAALAASARAAAVDRVGVSAHVRAVKRAYAHALQGRRPGPRLRREGALAPPS
jgi:glycosyltransferase involved in cell wall biosynthesis